MARDKRRKKILVDPRIQGALVKQLLLHWVLFVCTTCIVCLGAQFLWGPVVSGTERTFLLRLTVFSFLASSLCLLPVFIRDSLKLSHRFVGPIVRLRSILQKVGGSELLPSLHIRKRDYFQDLFEDVRGMVDRVAKLQAKTQRGDEPLKEDAERELETADV